MYEYKKIYVYAYETAIQNYDINKNMLSEKSPAKKAKRKTFATKTAKKKKSTEKVPINVFLEHGCKVHLPLTLGKDTNDFVLFFM